MSDFDPLRTLACIVMLPIMTCRLFMVLLAFVAVAAPVAAQGVSRATEVARIEKHCGLKKGTITVRGNDIRLRPSAEERYERVNCALERLKKAGMGNLGFVGNEIDPAGVVRPPIRYIAEGSSAEIAAIVGAAKADGWVITRTATASDGTAIVQVESGPQMTHQQARHLLESIWRKAFGDVAFGLAPRKLSDPDPLGD